MTQINTQRAMMLMASISKSARLPREVDDRFPEQWIRTQGNLKVFLTLFLERGLKYKI